MSSDESHHQCMVQLLESAARLYFDKIIVYIGKYVDIKILIYTSDDVLSQSS